MISIKLSSKKKMRNALFIIFVIFKLNIPSNSILKKFLLSYFNPNVALIILWIIILLANVIFAKKILKNEMYIGNMVQHTLEKISYNQKKLRKVDEENRIIVKNTHEPIIDKETFETAQLLIKVGNNATEKSYDYLLKNQLFF